MADETRERLPDPRTWDPNEHDAVPHREGDMSEGLQWKFDVLLYTGGRNQAALIQIHKCIDSVKVLLSIIIALLLVIIVLTLAILTVLNIINFFLLLMFFLLSFITALLAFFIVQVVVPFVIARNQARRAGTP